ncbi:hypothetical protein ASPZODRAFT_140765 [Penicilliopsis zonata CBS 506.65]|uniref:PhoD-like phosphatase metallophosphatase domain-containing protein n=1 Tax=Penicilliopsis zonata CBS 506.65 TaxID=1073090 RepID=A0A1L9SMZ8_9EURO|nr:hypothetical protein ASPZODRAFT_140765 [Penicilliopsis zonata CBS 506.65]OJJ48471.1 hypothetical protein ASPZODRAFT_140765 [Penicilliopsis zonata CBS 506.65]
MVSFHCVAVVTSSAIIRITAVVFLRWIPGHHFPPLILSSLVVYLTSLSALLADRGFQKSSAKRSTTSDAKKDDRSAIKSLITGLPSRYRAVTRLTAFTNILLAVLTLDFLLRGLVFYPSADVSFARIGYVSPTTANLLVREPDLAQLPLVVFYQEDSKSNQDKWMEEGVIYSLDTTTDYTAPVMIRNLKPSTQYRYSLSNNVTGTFQTAPLPGSKEAKRLTFLSSSCIKANFPYSPFLHPLRIPGIEQLAQVVANLPSVLRPAFMLFLGDFIYVDVPFRFGSSRDHYRSEYRRVYSSPSWALPAEDPAINLPWLHTLDDHEIANDWSKGNTTAPYPAAADPYAHYHVSVNPPIPPLAFAEPANTTYFSFIHGPASFFMLDTRTYRSEPAQPESTILGSAQLQSLLVYLARPEPSDVRWKIVASSVPFTKNWHVGTTDTWGGFLNERRTVFEAMWRAERELGVRVVLLSGDRHEFGATRFPDPNLLQLDGQDAPAITPFTAGEGVHEFSVGPLNMFYLPVRTYRQTDNEDVAVKYVPDGNSKFGMIEITDTEDGDVIPSLGITAPSSTLTYSLYVDGEPVWKYKLSVPHLQHASGRLPAGSVVLDETVSSAWDVLLKTTIGRIEEVGFRVWRGLNERYYEYFDRLERVERL